jgi:molybdopterin/thiamine biosynthesis adenylyltransferase
LKLDAAARRRYARQLLLGEIGESGQERLLGSTFTASAASDGEAFSVAAEYLERAGLSRDDAGDEVPVPDRAAVMRFADKALLEEPAAAIIGAFCALEHLKAVLGIAEARPFPSELKLSTES